MTVPKVRIRARRPKTKTGCLTCRLRRVKCDEAKPACLNCAKNGRTCAGYRVVQEVKSTPNGAKRQLKPKHDQPPYVYLPVISTAKPWYWALRDLSSDEGAALTFFRHRTARELRGSSELQIWERWAMQLSHYEPAVLHGLVAVGAIHRLAVEKKLDVGLNVESETQVALRSYGRALSQLRRSIAKSACKPDASLVLLASLLFFSFEMLRGDDAVAMQHLQAGLRIVADQEVNNGSSEESQPTSVRLSTSPAGALEELVATFAMLDFDNAMLSFRRVEPPLVLSLHGTQTLPRGSIQFQIDSMSQARAYLNVLGNDVFRLLKELSVLAEQSAIADGFDSRSPRFWCYVNTLGHSVHLGTSSDAMLSRKRTLERQMDDFAAALGSFSTQENSSDNRALLALEAQTILLTFHIVNCRATHETACDTFDARFQRAVDLAERYIHTAPAFADKGCYSKRAYNIEPGVVPTLCLVAAKCRDPSTRRRAIELLKYSALQEALWDSTSFGAFVERLATLEEETALRLTGKQSREDLRNSSDIPEQARFVDINLVQIPSQPGRHKLLCARYAHELDGSIVFFEEELAT